MSFNFWPWYFFSSTDISSEILAGKLTTFCFLKKSNRRRFNNKKETNIEHESTHHDLCDCSRLIPNQSRVLMRPSSGFHRRHPMRRRSFQYLSPLQPGHKQPCSRHQSWKKDCQPKFKAATKKAITCWRRSMLSIWFRRLGGAWVPGCLQSWRLRTVNYNCTCPTHLSAGCIPVLRRVVLQARSARQANCFTLWLVRTSNTYHV